MAMKYWSILETKKEYTAALKRIEELMDADPSPKSREGKELRLLLYRLKSMKMTAIR
jgi:antitoxin component HigA of HigAB toxin-antitoxin module